jgi:hypothetical protein
MARGGGGGGVGMAGLIGIGVAVLGLAIIFMLAPQIGGQMDANMPVLSATSDWNASYNTALKTGADIWQTLSVFLMLVGIVYLAAVMIMYLRGII